jgi:hypothetical protein
MEQAVCDKESEHCESKKERKRMGLITKEQRLLLKESEKEREVEQ